MDMSKLPRLSKSDKPADNAAPVADPEVPVSERLDDTYATVSPGPEAWVSIAIGVLVLLMNRTFLMYLLGREVPTVLDTERGTITYPESFIFLSHLGLFAFGITLILDGILLFLNRPGAVLFGLVVTIATAVFNLYVVLRLYGPQGLYFSNSLAFVFAVYTAIYQWKLLRIVRGHRAAPMT